MQPPRPVMLLVNKADLLTEYQRRAWAKYFESIGVRFAFYSAQDEQEKIDVAATRAIAVADRGSGTISGHKGLSEDDEEVKDVVIFMIVVVVAVVVLVAVLVIVAYSIYYNIPFSSTV